MKVNERIPFTKQKLV